MTAALYLGSRSLYPRYASNCPAGRCIPLLATSPVAKVQTDDVVKRNGLISDGWTGAGKPLEPLQ
jgi:hypothetical protein